MASSARLERVFSAFGSFHSKVRNRLEIKEAGKLFAQHAYAHRFISKPRNEMFFLSLHIYLIDKKYVKCACVLLVVHQIVQS